MAARDKEERGVGGGWGGCEVNCSPPKVFAERVNPRSSHPARLSSAPQIN